MIGRTTSSKAKTQAQWRLRQHTTTLSGLEGDGSKTIVIAPWNAASIC